MNIWEIGNEINGEWLSTVNCTGGTECVEPPQTVTSGYNMIPWEETYIPAAMHNGLKYVFVSYYETDNDNIRPSRTEWDAIFKRLAADFPNAKVGFGEIGMDNPVGSGTLVKAENIFRYYRGLSFPDIPRYTRAGFWWYGAEDLVPMSRWPAFFREVQSTL